MKILATLSILALALFSSTMLGAPSTLRPYTAEMLPAPSAPPTTTADAAYLAGVTALAAGDLTSAERTFRQALEYDPKHPFALLGLAELAFRKNRLDEADKLIQDAARIAPESAHVQASLGRMLAILKRQPQAEAALRKAMELDPKLIRPRIDLADLMAATPQRAAEALQLYQDIVTIAPEHAGAYYAMGITHARLGAYPKARTALETAARLEPSNPLPPLALARLNLQERDLQAAVRQVNRALEIQPTLIEALELRGDIEQMRNAEEAALSSYAAALRINPRQTSVLLKQGSLYQRLGRHEAARAAYLEATRANPKLAIAYNNLAWMAAESGKDLEQARKWGHQAVTLEPAIAEFHDTLGWVYRAQGQLAEAERILRHATGLDNASATAFYHLGVIQLELRKHEAAATAFKRALALEPDFQPAAQALATVTSR